jgi:heme-degrading monooxygenase HmoA
MEAGSGNVFLVLWEFRIAPEVRENFERIYGGEGAWAQLFRRSEEYCGTRLFQDTLEPSRYVTFDFWRSEAGYRAFKEQHHAEYEEIDRRCEALTTAESLLGEFLQASL